jgi:signal transduction histidine kinase
VKRIAIVAIPVASVLLLVGAALLIGSPEPLVWLPLSLATAVIGALLWARRAGGVLAGLFVLIGLSTPAGVAASAYALHARDRGWAAAGWAAWVAQGAIGLSVLFFLIPQLFPTGRPASARWRRLAVATVIDAAALVVIPSLGPSTLFMDNHPGVAHPVAIIHRPTVDVLYNVANTASLAIFVASAIVVVLRYRRARGDERLQMKWFAAAAVVAAIGLVVGVGIVPDGPAIVFALLAPLIPIAAGIAILRYRLYDIDVVISRALRYTLLAAFITIVYVAIVVGAGLVSGSASSHIASIAATVVVAVLFQPVRARAERLANRLVYGERATPYEVMAGFSARVADTVSTDDVLPQMAEAAGRGVGAVEAVVRVALPVGGARVERWTGETGIRTGDPWTVRVAYQGEPVGELTVRKPVDDPLTPAERELLADLGAQAGLALHNVRLTEELGIRVRELDEQAAALRLSRERLVTARDAQRRALQRDIEAGAEHELLDIGRRLSEVRQPDDLDALVERANATLDELRDLARGIFPPLLADAGIVPALEAHVRKVGARASIEAPAAFSERRFDGDVEACVYFCCLQAIQNVLRHAGNAPTTVRFDVDADDLAFEIADGGPGFDVATQRRGMGLQIIQDRLDALEGSLVVTSSPSGTRVIGRVPIRRPASAATRP